MDLRATLKERELFNQMFPESCRESVSISKVKEKLNWRSLSHDQILSKLEAITGRHVTITTDERGSLVLEGFRYRHGYRAAAGRSSGAGASSPTSVSNSTYSRMDDRLSAIGDMRPSAPVDLEARSEREESHEVAEGDDARLLHHQEPPINPGTMIHDVANQIKDEAIRLMQQQAAAMQAEAEVRLQRDQRDRDSRTLLVQSEMAEKLRLREEQIDRLMRGKFSEVMEELIHERFPDSNIGFNSEKAFFYRRDYSVRRRPIYNLSRYLSEE